MSWASFLPRALVALILITLSTSSPIDNPHSPTQPTNTHLQARGRPLFRPKFKCMGKFITRLCNYDPDPNIMQLGCICDTGKVKCHQFLANPWTWSEYSTGHPSAQELCREPTCNCNDEIDENPTPKNGTSSVFASNLAAIMTGTEVADDVGPPDSQPEAGTSGRTSSSGGGGGAEQGSSDPNTCPVGSFAAPPPSETGCKSCSGTCTSVTQGCSWAYLGLCRCTAQPIWSSHGSSFFGKCARVHHRAASGRGGRRLVRRQLLAPNTTALNVTTGGLDDTVFEVSKNGTDDTDLYNGTTLEQVACPCNASYVSYACCDSDNDIVYEHPSQKLGSLMVDDGMNATTMGNDTTKETLTAAMGAKGNVTDLGNQTAVLVDDDEGTVDEAWAPSASGVSGPGVSISSLSVPSVTPPAFPTRSFSVNSVVIPTWNRVAGARPPGGSEAS
ncbi:MAG: hypothetical protein M1817_006236 [Caeruleum heppii]|nr:MAG: hypothetical protein M1817_006236 [Caeruleum heppii]